MFKVICIREVKTLAPGSSRPNVQVGNMYTVTSARRCNCGCGHDYYVLEEDSPEMEYKESLFAPCDGPDEREILGRRIDTETVEKEYKEIVGTPWFVKFDQDSYDRIWKKIMANQLL